MRFEPLHHALLGLAFAAASSASAWTLPIDSAKPVDLFISQAAMATDGSVWAFGNLKTGEALAHYTADGQLDFVVPLGAHDFLVKSMTADEQGGLLLVGYYAQRVEPEPGRHCYVRQVDAGGKLRWETRTNPSCDAITTFKVMPPTQPDATGERWVHLGAEIVRLGGDGRVLKRQSYAELPGEAVAANAQTGALYLYDLSTVGARKTPLVIAQDKRGAERWRWSGTGFADDALLARTALAPDGSLRVVIRNSRGLHLVALGDDGSVRWSRKVDDPRDTSVFDIEPPRVDANGATWLVAPGSSALKSFIYRIGADGNALANRGFADIGIDGLDEERATRAAPGGDLVVVNGSKLLRIDATGSLRYSRTFGSDLYPADIEPLGFEPDGTLLVLRSRGGLLPELMRIDRNGADLPSPSLLGVFSDTVLADRALLPDSSIAVWTRGYQWGSRELLRVAGDGAPSWRRATPGQWSQTMDDSAGAVAANDDRICTLDSQMRTGAREFYVDCYRASDGTPLWSKSLGTAEGQSLSGWARLFLDTSGNLTAWYTMPSSPRRTTNVHLDPDGKRVGTIDFPGVGLVDDLPNDAPYVLMMADRESEIALADPAGQLLFRRNHSNAGTINSTFAVGADGTLVFLRRPATGGVEVEAIDRAGGTRWTRKLEGGSERPLSAAVIGSAVYVGTSGVASNPGEYARRIAQLSLADGAPGWSREFPIDRATREHPQHLAALPAGGGIIAAWSQRNALALDLLDASTGAVRASRREACRSPDCSVGQPLIGNGRVHVVDRSYTGMSSLVAWTLPAASAIRLDQPGITGAWWAPYANGEGFVLDWLPSSRTLFMPWFTFSREGGNDPAGQRWYSIAGEVPANATRVELPIAEAVGGAFDDPQAVTRRVIGKATLNFTDCDNGTLQYAFDAPYNGGATGTVTLSRLSPATQDCRLANGSSQTRAAAPANGFDARMSGSWYEEATSGQGLQFTVQPGGVFFAPWFTFDPKGAADDPDNQRWFSIQGSLANANDGMVELPIAQALGGAFDSVPTNNFSIVGKATLTMQSCERAKVEYRFDDNELAGAMRGKAGTLDLIKAGGCAP